MYQHQLWSCYQNVQIFLFNILKTVDIVQNASAVASSDRTDLSTECGSGPIQLAVPSRPQIGRRFAAALYECAAAHSAHCRPQAKKR